jgi:putative ABC transport system ATP-binding protein
VSKPIALRLDGVTRAFGDVAALAGVSLAVEQGEILAILGPSGCGKTTLLNAIAGHLHADAGRIEIAGRVVVDDSLWVGPQDRGVAMVFQDYALFPHLTVVENVAFALPKEQRKGGEERARELLDLLDVAELAERRPTELSGGQQQRVAVARALLSKPAVIFGDEPTGNLDSKTSGEVLDLLRRAVDEFGQTVIMVTHDASAAAIADRVLFLRDGKIVRDAGRLSAGEILDTIKTLE